MTLIDPSMRADVLRRFQAYHAVVPNGCWPWLRHITVDGYGRLKVNGRDYGAHRVAYDLFVGSVPKGLEIDHLCRNRACVNPDHLEAVTHRVNSLRGLGPIPVNAHKVTCINGHEFTPENTYIRPNGARDCRACNRARTRAYSRRVRQTA